MLRYKIVLPEYGTPGIVVRDMNNQHDICTCRNRSNAEEICRALNFYYDWVLIDNGKMTAPEFGKEEKK